MKKEENCPGVRQWTHVLVTTCLLSTLSLALSGCSNPSVEAETDFPVPVMPKIDMTLGLFLDETLTHYVHEETIEQMGDWRIDIGAAQKAMFTRVTEGMFEKTQLLTSLEAGDTQVDAILHPVIRDFQFSTPQQTRSDYFEVWLKYRIELYDNSGQLIADWPLTAYGKSNAQNYGFMQKTREPAIMEAARVALRDAAAFFALKFARVREIADWLESRQEDVKS